MKFYPQIFVKEAILFGATLILGLVVASRTIVQISVEPLIQASSITSGDIVIFIIAIAGAWLITRAAPRILAIIFWIFISLVILSGTQLTLSAFVPSPQELYGSFIVLFIFYLFRNVLVHNIVIILAIAGIGAAVGTMITPMVAILVFVLLSFYDIIAVYKTRHMVRMAEGMVRSGAIFGFIIPARFRLFLASRREAQARIGDDFMILGSGDIGLPVIFASSLLRQSTAEAVIVAIFSLGGLLLTHLLFMAQPKRQAMAALPPIATMAILGYVVSLLFNY